jgi:hypothetical protein
MALIVNMAMILIGIFAILMFKYLEENINLPNNRSEKKFIGDKNK